MVIVKISGGLGNQMYQYALYRRFQEAGIDAKMSLSYFRDETLMRTVPGHSTKYLLNDVFEGVIENFSTEEEDCKYRLFSNNSFFRFLARKGLVQNLLIEDIQGSKTNYIPTVLSRKHGYLDGYWQSPKYSEGIISKLRSELSFRKPLVGRNAEIATEIARFESVSIHVRRGDYVNTEYELLGEPYYHKAIALIKKKIENPIFYIFSDDIEWCKKNLGVEGTFITWNKGDKSYIDMQLMSLCKANIVANSTFSIWAAMLNRNNPLVIHPFKYSKYSVQKKDRWPEEWIEIVY